ADVNVGTVSVTLPPGNQPKIFSLLKKDLPVTDPLGQPLKLMDLKRHDRLAMMIPNEEDTIAGIRVESDLDWGVVRSIDVERREIIVQFAYVPRPLKVGPEVRLWQGGQPAMLKDLKVQQPIKVLLNPDRAS